MIEMTFLKQLILIREMHQKSVIFVTIDTFLDKEFKFEIYVCNGCHNELMMYKNLCDIAIWKLYSIDYCCIITSVSKSEALNLQNIDSNEKCRTLKKIKIYYQV